MCNKKNLIFDDLKSRSLFLSDLMVMLKYVIEVILANRFGDFDLSPLLIIKKEMLDREWFYPAVVDFFKCGCYAIDACRGKMIGDSCTCPIMAI